MVITMMYILIGILSLLTLALSQLVSQNITSPNIVRLNHSLDDVGDYIYLNRLHFTKVIQNFDIELKKYKQLYTERLERINVHLDLLMYEIIKNEERLKGLEILSDANRKCIVKYRDGIPKLTETKTAGASCIEKISQQFESILLKPETTRNTLNTYITTTYETEIRNCGNKYVSPSTNYTICVTGVTATANTYTAASQKKFASQMKLADCFSDEKIKRAVDCIFSLQNRTISAIAVSNVLINKCIEGTGECDLVCDTSCSNVQYVQFSNTTTTISNPFYHHQYSHNCLILVQQSKIQTVHSMPRTVEVNDNKQDDVRPIKEDVIHHIDDDDVDVFD